MIEFEWNRKFSTEEQAELNRVALNHSGTPIVFNDDGCIKDYGYSLAMRLEDAARFGTFKVLRCLPHTVHQTPETRPHPPVNEKCHVAVPGLGLLLIDEAKVWQNLCTDELQRQLDEGWRILAICPQPDQRRPDYVLGRSKK